MPLPETIGDRLKRCSRIVKEGEPPQADMAQFMEYCEACLALEALLDHAGRHHVDFNLDKMLQCAVLYVRCTLLRTVAPAVVQGELIDTLNTVAVELGHLAAESADFSPLIFALQSSILIHCGEYDQICQVTHLLLCSLDDWPQRTEALTSELRAAGCAPALTGAQLRVLAHYLRSLAGLQMLESVGSGWKYPPPEVAAQADADSAALVALAKGNPRYLLLRARVLCGMMQWHRAVPLCHQALKLAIEQRAHFWAGQAALDAAMLLMCGADGAQVFSTPEACRLLDLAESEYRLSQAWAETKAQQGMEAAAARLRGVEVEAALRRSLRLLPCGGRVAAPGDGQELLPVRSCVGWWAALMTPNLSSCAACGSSAAAKLQCTGCCAVAYCSPDCQAKHWGEGHKQLCLHFARQAARRHTMLSALAVFCCALAALLAIACLRRAAAVL